MPQALARPAPAGPPASASLDTDVLRSLVAIADAGSIALAAPRVARTPSAISMQIKKLEETLGRALFARSREGMQLTPDGERLLPHARRLIEAERAALDEFRQPDLEGELNVGLIDDFGGVPLSEVLAGFARAHPLVVLNVAMGPSVLLGRQIAAGALDLAVLAPGACVALGSTDLLLHEEPVAWVGAEAGDACHRRPLPLAISAPGCPWRRTVLASLDRHGLRYRVAFASEYYAALKAAVRADLAVAPLPRSKVEPGMRVLGEAEGLPDPGRCQMALSLGADPSPAAKALWRRIAEYFGKAP